jgi:hypothetical protein
MRGAIQRRSGAGDHVRTPTFGLTRPGVSATPRRAARRIDGRFRTGRRRPRGLRPVPEVAATLRRAYGHGTANSRWTGGRPLTRPHLQILKAVPVPSTRAELNPVAANHSLYSASVLCRASPRKVIMAIKHSDPVIRLAGHGNHLDHEQPVASSHPLPAPHQDRPAFRIPRVVQSLAEEPDVSMDLHRLKEASSDQLAPFTHSSSREQVVRVGEHVRPIEQNAPNAGISGNDGSHQRTRSGSDVHDRVCSVQSYAVAIAACSSLRISASHREAARCPPPRACVVMLGHAWSRRIAAGCGSREGISERRTTATTRRVPPHRGLNDDEPGSSRARGEGPVATGDGTP